MTTTAPIPERPGHVRGHVRAEGQGHRRQVKAIADKLAVLPTTKLHPARNPQ
jgi:hypothetical protein